MVNKAPSYKIYNKTIFKMIRLRFIRFLLTILIILVSVSATAGLGNMLNEYTPGYKELFSKDNAPDVIMKYVPEEGETDISKMGFKDDDLNKVKTLDNVKDASFIFNYDYISAEEKDNLRLTMYEDLSKKGIGVPILAKGELPKEFSLNIEPGKEVKIILNIDTLINEKVDGTTNHNIGDIVSFNLPYGTYNITFNLKIVGTATSSLYTSTQKERANSVEEAYVSTIYFTSTAIIDNPLLAFPHTDIYVEMNNKSEYLSDAYKAEANILKDNISTLFKDKVAALTLEENTSYALFKSYTVKVYVIISIVPLFFLLVTALVTLIISSRLVADERSFIACYASLGISKAQIYRKYLTFTVIAALIGVIVGYFIGIYSLPVLIYGAFGTVFRLPTITVCHFSLIGIIVSITILLTAFLVTMYSVHKSLKETPAQLLLPKAPKAGKRILLERIKWLWKRLPFGFKSSIRNIFRQKKNLILTSLSVIGSEVLIFLGLGIRDDANAFKNHPLFGNVANSIGTVSLIVSIYGVVMASLIIYSLASMNVDDREREIAILKVLGYNDVKCALYTSRELIMITLVAGIIGIPIAMGLAQMVFGFLDFGGIGEVTAFTYIMSYSLVAISSVISSLFLYPKIKRIDYNISLKARE